MNRIDQRQIRMPFHESTQCFKPLIHALPLILPTMSRKQNGFQLVSFNSFSDLSGELGLGHIKSHPECIDTRISSKENAIGIYPFGKENFFGILCGSEMKICHKGDEATVRFFRIRILQIVRPQPCFGVGHLDVILEPCPRCHGCTRRIPLNNKPVRSSFPKKSVHPLEYGR